MIRAPRCPASAVDRMAVARRRRIWSAMPSTPAEALDELLRCEPQLGVATTTWIRSVCAHRLRRTPRQRADPALDRVGRRRVRQEPSTTPSCSTCSPSPDPVGEALVLHESRWWRDADGNGWFDIEERADRTSKRRQPPKHRKHREMWVPAWLADDLEANGPRRDGWWFEAPEGGTWPVNRWRKRRSIAGPIRPAGRSGTTPAITRRPTPCTKQPTAPSTGRTVVAGGGACTPGATMRPATSFSNSALIQKTWPATSATATATPAGNSTSVPAHAESYASPLR